MNIALEPASRSDLLHVHPSLGGTGSKTQSISPPTTPPANAVLGLTHDGNSEFAQSAPLWARQPYKSIYYIYFGLSVGFFYLPLFALQSIRRKDRGRPSWSWSRATLVRLYRHGTRLTFRTHMNLGRDLNSEVPHSETLRGKFVWVDPLREDEVRGELARAAKLQKVGPSRTCGFWFGEREGGGAVGTKAKENEKVVYHLHGGAYWIGTAHESDVTAAVSTELLRALNQVHGERTRCKRTFSLDYRLAVPGHPRLGSYPAALFDALAGYAYLVRRCQFEPENIIVVGDSAGGNLALALCRYLRDEPFLGMPGSLALLSPWSDVSRSHSGPLHAPNPLSSAIRNQKSDIISPSPAFRNTAVSALIGHLPPSETYVNPYLSPVSLQLPPGDGGSPPDWGFYGFPRRIYISTGSGEINADQHLTLAHRLAAGGRLLRPRYEGDKLSASSEFDADELAARRKYPRPPGVSAAPHVNRVPSYDPAEAVRIAQDIARSKGLSAVPRQLRNGARLGVPGSEGSEVGEDREVVLDEVKDAIHDFLLFSWFEPERGRTWRRIAKWIEEDL